MGDCLQDAGLLQTCLCYSQGGLVHSAHGPDPGPVPHCFAVFSCIAYSFPQTLKNRRFYYELVGKN